MAEIKFSDVANFGADVILGQIVDNQFVPQVFSGTIATAGTPESYTNLYTYNTAQKAAGGANYYKCASVNADVVVSGSGTDACNGTYTLTSGIGSSRVWTYGGYKIYWDGEGKWIIELISDGTAYYTAEDYTGASDPWDLTWMNSAGASPEPTVTKETPTEKTWSGYKAVINETTEIWSFEKGVTSGLTYDKLIPVVGSVYDEECTHKCTDYYVGIPTEGLVFYAPLTEESSTAATGQTMTAIGSHSFETVGGIACMRCWGTGGYTADFGLSGNTSCTLSIWNRSTAGRKFNFCVPDNVGFEYGSAIFTGSSSNYINWPSQAANTWWHFCLVLNNGSAILYVNGTQTATGTATTLGSSLNDGKIASGPIDSSNPNQLSRARIYNRALSAEEVTALYSELTPTNA